MGNITTGHGLLDQINQPYNPYEFYPSITNQEPFTVIEVGDYSMIVKESLENYTILDIRGIKVTESIKTPEGTILYFSDKLPEEMKYYSTVYANVRRRRILNMSLLEEMIQKQFVSSSGIMEAYRTSAYLSDAIDKLTKETNNGKSK